MHKFNYYFTCLFTLFLVVFVFSYTPAQNKYKKSAKRTSRYKRDSIGILTAIPNNTKEQAIKDKLYYEAEAVSQVNNFELSFFSGDVTDLDFDITELSKIEGKNYALFIGVNKYDDKVFKTLDRPVADAHKLRNTLTDLYTFEPENTDVLENPSRKEIIDKLNDLSTKAGPKDNVLIFYAGHGKMDRNIGYWIPSDAKEKDESTWFSNSELKDKLNKIDSKHTLLIADACFSGAVFLTRSGSSMVDAPDAILKLYNNKSRRAFSSSGFTEAFDNSAFLESLVKNLVKNKERFLPAHNLSMGVIETVLNQSSQFQVPQYGSIPGSKDEGGSFIFIRKK